jgi:hypothetical protein
VAIIMSLPEVDWSSFFLILSRLPVLDEDELEEEDDED